jgi:hypothetical protein
MTMRKFAIGAVFAFAISSPSFAQDEDFGGEAETETPPPAGGNAETAEGDAPPSVGETHAVKSGDTLWDLCAKYLNSPWYWPKIWSYNPQITNPHWIYPGNELRFYPSDENLPTNVEVARATEVPDEDLNTGELDPDELVKTTGSIQVGKTAPDSVWTTLIGFVSAEEQDKAGQIINAEEETIMLSDYDRVYMKLKTTGKKGDRMAIYRTVREIEHPVTGQSLGYAIEIVGGVEVIDTSPVVATGQVAQAFRPIERGDYVGKWPDYFGQRVQPVQNTAEAQGYIVETVGDILGLLGEHHLVFIDRGRSHGVQRGNVFRVVTRGDLYTRETEDLPNEEVGQIMVLDVQEDASTAIVTYALRELAVGDKIEMRRN